MAKYRIPRKLKKELKSIESDWVSYCLRTGTSIFPIKNLKLKKWQDQWELNT